MPSTWTVDIVSKFNNRNGREASKMNKTQVTKEIQILKQKLKNPKLTHQERNKLDTRRMVFEDIRYYNRDFYGKKKVNTDFYTNKGYLDKQSLVTLEKLRNPFNNQRAREYAFGIKERNKNNNSQGPDKRLHLTLLQGTYGQAQNFTKNETKEFKIEGHTHPPYDFTKYKQESRIVKGVSPELKFKYEKLNKRKFELDKRLYDMLNDSPSSTDVSWMGHYAKPNMVLTGESISIGYPGRNAKNLSKAQENYLDTKSRYAFANAILKNELGKSKSLPEYERRISKTKKDHQKNLKNLYSKYDIELVYKNKSQHGMSFKH